MWGDGVPYLDFVVPHFNVSPTGHVGLWAWVQDVEICIDNFEVTEGVPPDSPTGLVATAADGAVDLEWDDNLDLDLQFYSVYRSEMSGSNFAVIAQPTESDYQDTDVVHSLKVLFLGQGEIPFPGLLPDDSHPCGVDPTMDDVAGCVVYEATIACP